MHSAAYILLHAMREKMLQGTEYANATMKTIRLRLIKVAAYVKEIKTRIKIELPKQFPDMEVIANCLANSTGYAVRPVLKTTINTRQIILFHKPRYENPNELQEHC